MKLTEHGRQRTYNVTLWLVYVTVVAKKKQQHVPFVLLTYT
jgi:hypothetical protein